MFDLPISRILSQLLASLFRLGISDIHRILHTERAYRGIAILIYLKSLPYRDVQY